MNAYQYSIARVAEQYRRRLLSGERLTPEEAANNEVVRAATLEYEGWEENRRRDKGETASMRSCRNHRERMAGAQA